MYARKICFSPKNGAVSVNKIQSYFLVSFGSFIIRASTFQVPGADLDPRAEMGPAWAGITFGMACLGFNCAQMASGGAESDFGLWG